MGLTTNAKTRGSRMFSQTRKYHFWIAKKESPVYIQSKYLDAAHTSIPRTDYAMGVVHEKVIQSE